MNGKRLFWASIIVVELVVIYVLWRPHTDHSVRPRRTAVARPATLPPEREAAPVTSTPESKGASASVTPPPGSGTLPAAKAPVAKSAPKVPLPAPRAKGSTVAMIPSKPSPILHAPPRVQRKAPAINAGLISREPIPLKKLAPPAPLSPLESFWCQMSTLDSNCNCKGTEERAANTLLP